MMVDNSYLLVHCVCCTKSLLTSHFDFLTKCYYYAFFFLLLPEMFIGFTKRIQSVSEGEVQPEEYIPITVNVSTNRMSEINYNVYFQYQDVTSSAIVEPLSSNESIEYDALFGERLDLNEPILELQEIKAGQTSTSIQLLIFNDLIPEEEECFTLRILPVDVVGLRNLPECNENGDSFFCEHTICIIDDDGKYKDD